MPGNNDGYDDDNDDDNKKNHKHNIVIMIIMHIVSDVHVNYIPESDPDMVSLALLHIHVKKWFPLANEKYNTWCKKNGLLQH